MSFQKSTILVTTRTFERFGEAFNAVPRNLSQRLQVLGHEVRPVGPGLSFNWSEGNKPIAVIFSGGDDIGADSDRDSFETELLEIASEKEVPVIGICRGAQLISSAFNGSLVKSDSHVNRASTLSGPELTFTVTCFHSFEIEQLGNGLEVILRDNEGKIEGFQDSRCHYLGVMWHPEREPLDSPAWDWFAQKLAEIGKS